MPCSLNYFTILRIHVLTNAPRLVLVFNIHMQLAVHFVHSERLVFLGDASPGLSVRLMFSPFCWFSNAQAQLF